MAICLLLLFSMLVTLCAGLLFFLSHTAAEVYLYREGLRSVYAAESGANWGIGYLQGGGREDAAVSFAEDGRSIRVNVTVDEETQSGTIESTAQDGEGGNQRVLLLTYTLADEAVKVTDVRTGT